MIETLREEHSLSISPFPSEEDLETLEKYAPGSSKRLINVTIDRIAVRTELMREDAKASREINRRGQHYALIFGLTILGVSTVFAFLGYPTQAAFIATTLVVAVVVAFLVGDEVSTVVPWLMRSPDRNREQDSNDRHRDGDRRAIPEESQDRTEDD